MYMHRIQSTSMWLATCTGVPCCRYYVHSTCITMHLVVCRGDREDSIPQLVLGHGDTRPDVGEDHTQIKHTDLRDGRETHREDDV